MYVFAFNAARHISVKSRGIKGKGQDQSCRESITFLSELIAQKSVELVPAWVKNLREIELNRTLKSLWKKQNLAITIS